MNIRAPRHKQSNTSSARPEARERIYYLHQYWPIWPIWVWVRHDFKAVGPLNSACPLPPGLWLRNIWPSLSWLLEVIIQVLQRWSCVLLTEERRSVLHIFFLQCESKGHKRPSFLDLNISQLLRGFTQLSHSKRQICPTSPASSFCLLNSASASWGKPPRSPRNRMDP